MTAHVSDFKNDSTGIVLDLINEQNGTSLTREQLSFSDPIAGDGKSTDLVVTALRGSGFRGTFPVTYNRVELTEVPHLADDETLEADVSKYSDVLTFINGKFGVNVGVTDVTINGVDLSVEDPVVDGQFDETNIYDIVSKVKSLVWLGSTSVKLTPVRQDLGETWPNGNPDGLNAPPSYPSNTAMAQGTDGSTRTSTDGSVRTFAGPAN